MASGHIVASFDEDLADLKTMLARLGGLAEKQFADAMDALERRDIQNIDERVLGYGWTDDGKDLTGYYVHTENHRLYFNLKDQYVRKEVWDEVA